MVSDIPGEQVAAGLDAVVRRLLREAAVARPPVDPVLVAERVGLTVARDDRQGGRARLVKDAVRVGGRRGTIFIRSDPRPERCAWAVAHELGEDHAWQVCEAIGAAAADLEAATREWLANVFAARLLLPTAWFERDCATCDWDLHQLKERYRTASHELIGRRMLDGATPMVISVFDGGRCTFRRSNARNGAASATSRELSCRAKCAAEGCDVRWLGPPRVDAWAVHEPGWRREIVRMELFGDGDQSPIGSEES